MDSGEWSVRIKGRIDQDLVGGFLVSWPSDDESDLARLLGVQPKVRRFVPVIHVVQVVHILERHAENAAASKIDCRSARLVGFERLGDDLAPAWFLRERDTSL